jgi:cytochrome c peroxidase
MATRARHRGWRWGRATLVGVFAGLPVGLAAITLGAYLAHAEVPPVPVPPGNPITENKRVLGKVLFFDEQLSSTNAVACATCHVAGRAGTDPRLARNPGPDLLINTPDDKVASPGIIRSALNSDFVRDSVFGLNPQITGRAANSVINAAFAPSLFWDGRATPQFIDPQTGQTVLLNGGALESQSVAPPLSDVEMAHAGLQWGEITAKLAQVRPLDLATNLPADVAGALAGNPGYGELFRRAFGDTQISARRIAMAIATYERTLITDQTPWDAFRAGNPNALTQGQQAGLNTFIQNCAVCHTVQTGLFTDNSFRNIGLRPTTEDLGRQIVTGNTGDRGRFKVPGLRNVGLKTSFMHNGQFTSLQQLIAFYARRPGAAPQFPDNRDPAMNAINFPPQAEPALIDFLSNGLRDPRVANQTFPFDRPTLFMERPEHRATVIGGGTPGSGGIVPRIFAPDPPMVGNIDFRVGLDGALGGSVGRLGVSSAPPVNGRIIPDRYLETVVAQGGGAGTGLATAHWNLRAGEVTGGQTLFVQWFVEDPAGAGGEALSSVVRVPVFCGSAGCPAPCGYANCDGSTSQPYLNVADFSCFLQRFAAGEAYANCDGSALPPVLNVQDFTCFLQRYAAGCP